MPETVKVRAFGMLLKELRRSTGWSVARVVQTLEHSHKPPIEADQGTISGYEQGWRESPDPIVLWGLADVYNMPLIGLVAVLRENLLNPDLSVDEARATLMSYRHGPTPELAAEAIRATSTKLLRVVTDLEALATAAESGRQDTAPRGGPALSRKNH